MLNINLFGGPGLGKSATAYCLAGLMKKKDYNVEFVPEYAKDLTYGKDYTKLGDQLKVLGEQHHRVYRLKNDVEYLVHDSPFLLGLQYLEDDSDIPKEHFESLIVNLFLSYENLNIFIERDLDLPYHQSGRRQTKTEAIEIDNQVQLMLDKYDIPYVKIKLSDKIEHDIMKLIEDTKG